MILPEGSDCTAAGSSSSTNPIKSALVSGLSSLINASMSPMAGIKSGINGLSSEFKS